MTLFGQILHIQPGSGTAVFIVMLVTLLCFEFVVRYIEDYCSKKGFQSLSQKLIKEFMVMGVISFVSYFVFPSTPPSTNEIYGSFHFSHMIIFFIAFSFILQAVLLVGMLYLRNKQVLKFASKSCETLLAEYDAVNEPVTWKTYFFHYAPLFISYPSCRENVEYKIIEAYFIRIYQLRVNFNYSEYLYMSLHQHMIARVEIRPINWLILAGLVAANYARIRVLMSHATYRHCDSYDAFVYHAHDTTNSGTPSGHDDYTTFLETKHHCEEYMMSYVVFVLCLLLLFDLFLLFISNRYIGKLLNLVVSEEEEAEKRRRNKRKRGPSRFSLNIFSSQSVDSNSETAKNTNANAGTIIPQEGIAEAEKAAEKHERNGRRRGSMYVAVANNEGTSGSGGDIESQENVKTEGSSEGVKFGGLSVEIPCSQPITVGPSLLSSRSNSPSIETSISSDGVEDMPRHYYKSCLQRIRDQEMQFHILRNRRSGDEMIGKPITFDSLYDAAYPKNHHVNNARKSVGKHLVHHVSHENGHHSHQHDNEHREHKLKKDHVGHHTDMAHSHSDREDRSGTTATATEARTAADVTSDPSHDDARTKRRSSFHPHVHAILSRGSVQGDMLRNQLQEQESTRSNIAGERRASFHRRSSQSSRRGSMESVSGRSRRFSRKGSVHFFSQSSDNIEVDEEPRTQWIGIAIINKMKSILYHLWIALISHESDQSYESTEDPILKATQTEMLNIFYFQNPFPYYQAIEMALLLQCFYLALWATNFVKVASDLPNSAKWQVAILLPALVKMLVLSKVIYFAGLLRSVSVLDKEISEEVNEHADFAITTIEKLRTTFNIIMENLELNESDRIPFVHAQFKNYETDTDLEIMDYTHFCAFLTSMRVTLPDEKIHEIFSVIDTDCDGFIDWAGISVMLFPQMASPVKREMLDIVDDTPDFSHHVRRLSTLVFDKSGKGVEMTEDEIQAQTIANENSAITKRTSIYALMGMLGGGTATNKPERSSSKSTADDYGDTNWEIVRGESMRLDGPKNRRGSLIEVMSAETTREVSNATALSSGDNSHSNSTAASSRRNVSVLDGNSPARVSPRRQSFIPFTAVDSASSELPQLQPPLPDFKTDNIMNPGQQEYTMNAETSTKSSRKGFYPEMYLSYLITSEEDEEEDNDNTWEDVNSTVPDSSNGTQQHQRHHNSHHHSSAKRRSLIPFQSLHIPSGYSLHADHGHVPVPSTSAPGASSEDPSSSSDSHLKLDS